MSTKNESAAPPQEGESRSGFRITGLLLFLMILAGLIAQNLQNWLLQGDLPAWAGPLSAGIVLGLFLLLFAKPFYRVLDTPYFAVLCLLFIAIGTALGTFVTQNTPPDIFVQRYGDTGSKVLNLLNLHDVFHSWWYVGFFILLIGSLLKMSWRKGFGKGTLGFHLAHLSPLLVLAGFWVDYFYGFRGIIQLETGQNTRLVRIFEGSTNTIVDSMELAFDLQLDAFESEKHDPDYRMQIWRNVDVPQSETIHNQGPSTDMRPEIVASVPLEMGKVNHIYGTEFYFRLSDFFPNFQFDYTYPENADTIEAREPGIFLEMKTSLGETVLQMRSNDPKHNKLEDYTHLGSSLEFYWDLPEELSQGLFKKTVERTEEEVDRVVIVGAEEKVYYLVDGDLTVEKLEKDRYYPFPNKENSGFSLMLLFPDAAYLGAEPASKGDELLNPVAMVDVWGKDWKTYQEAYIYPSGGSLKGGIFSIPGSPYFLALESLKSRETKYWKSTVSVLDEEGQVVKTDEIKVNGPMLHQGYRFYQTDFDPRNPNYSGIGVSHEPGLYIIYFGFVVLAVGCFLLFYHRRKAEEEPV